MNLPEKVIAHGFGNCSVLVGHFFTMGDIFVRNLVVKPYTPTTILRGAIYRGRWVEEVAGPLMRRYDLDIDLHERGVNGEQGSPRTLFEKLCILAHGFRASGFWAPVIVFLLFLDKLRLRTGSA